MIFAFFEGVANLPASKALALKSFPLACSFGLALALEEFVAFSFALGLSSGAFSVAFPLYILGHSDLAGARTDCPFLCLFQLGIRLVGGRILHNPSTCL